MFTIHTIFDQKSATAMAKGLRKTIRRKRNKRSRALGILAVCLGILLLLFSQSSGLRSIITLIAVLAMGFALIWEDSINGYFARKRILPGTEETTTTFCEEGYHCVTHIAESCFTYESVQFLVKNKNYIVCVFSQSHGQVYDIRTLTGGSLEEFVGFLQEKTGKEMVSI